MRPPGVFPDGEAVAFLLEGTGDPPRAAFLSIEGRERGEAKVEPSAEGRLRLEARGLEPGHYRLVLRSADGKSSKPRSFAVLPPPGSLDRRGSALASDGAISWLVAPKDVPDCLRLARLAGIRMLRDRIEWGEVERKPGEYRWGRYDAVAEASREAGIEVYQIFHASPRWSRADGDRKRMPDDLALR